MDNRYSGWLPLVGIMRAACKLYDVVPYTKSKDGYLAVEIPADAPEPLHQLAEVVEQLSDRICQGCGSVHAMEARQPATGWILKVCLSCRDALLGQKMNNERQV